MLLDAALLSTGIDDVAGTARDLEARGYAGVWASEADHDPFLPLLTAGLATDRLQVGTAIAVAFARSPMTLAMTAHDLQRYTRGRFVLGLGSQVKPHVERRFSMPWSPPVERMREYVAALRAIWSAWQDGTRLRFQGEHYRHTLMTPMFSPPAHEWGAPPVHLAAVGPGMTRLAGEVADGLLAHGFTTARYLRERTLPVLAEGLEAAGRSREEVTVSLPGFVVTGRTERRARRGRRGGEGDHRLLRQHPGLPAGAGAARLGRPSPTSCTRCRSAGARTSGRRCATWSTTRCWARSRWSGSRRTSARPSARGSTGWSTGSASTPPIPPRWTSGTRWPRRSADLLRRRGGRPAYWT